MGDNIGVFVLPLSQVVGARGHMLAIEAPATTAAYLWQNVSENHVRNVTIVEEAAADSNSTRSFYQAPSDQCRGSSLGPSPGYAATEVRTRALDEMLEEAGVSHVRWLTVDVGGFEAGVLRGAQRLLNRPDPPVILFEFYDWAEPRAGEPSYAEPVLLSAGYYATPQYLRRWLVGAIALTLVSPAVLLGIGAGTFYFTLCRLDGLALGGLVAIAAREQGGLQRLVRPALWTMAGLSPVIAILMVLFSGEGTPLVQVVKSTLLGAWFALFLVVLVQAPVASLLHRAFSMRALRSVGTYSYAMYVFHPFVFGILASHLRHYPLAIQGIGACVAVYLAAYASWMVWERHFLALKDRFDYVRPAA